ncbi:hypothetical protein BDV98DRAFT_396960 [Pterulicium gracile]|uniref:Uncharacterized protein n=1 Tax=Pterulicium gracile TaxID=1884261 RepID=A0A5C3QPD0_9AGAR|nr:hypothetical protein BDV98DRAFT_396960 [Pterula gracilis]
MVLDIVFQKGDKLEAVSVSTSYATQGDPASVSPLLDSLMLQLVRSFLAVTLHEDADPWKAARLGEVISAQFRDLFLLDSLASQQTNGGGSMWFTHTKTVDEIASELAKTEAQAVSSSLNATHASLDVFLLRSHALPLPFLASVFMSFLVHLSPRAYLQLKRSSSASDGPWDIPTSSLTSFLSAHPRPPGTVCAELKLVKRTQDAAADFHMGSTRPSISQDVPTDHTFPTVENYSWTLDFTGNGDPRKGVVTCQSRLKEIETVVHGSGLDVLPGASFGASSWVDLLLDSRGHFEHYTCEYTSPSSAHPPLHLRLANPAEPGFILERVPVKTMKDVWAVLEVIGHQ